MDKQKIWGILKLILKVGLMVLLIYYVFQKINLQQLRKLFLESNPYYLLLAFVLYYSSQIVSSWRSKGLLANIGLHLDFGFNLRLYLLGMFYNMFLPGGVGGDGYKIYILRKKYKLPTKRLFFAMLFDRLSGLWAIGLITVGLILFIPKMHIPATLPIILFVIGTVIYYAVMRKYFKDYSKKFTATHLKAWGLQSLQILSVIAILYSQDFDGKFSPYLFSFLLASLAASFPFSVPGGIGVREYVMIKVADYFGMDANLAVFVTFVFYIISALSSLSGSVFIYRSKEFAPPPKEAEMEQEGLSL